MKVFVVMADADSSQMVTDALHATCRTGSPIFTPVLTNVAHTASPDSPKIKPKGIKLDAGKAPMDLIPPEAMWAMANRLRIGAKKYARRNWEEGIVFSRVFAAILRHLWAWWGGEDIDSDGDGSSHLEAVLINAAFLVAFEKRGRTDLDDRPSHGR